MEGFASQVGYKPAKPGPKLTILMLQRVVVGHMRVRHLRWSAHVQRPRSSVTEMRGHSFGPVRCGRPNAYFICDVLPLC